MVGAEQDHAERVGVGHQLGLGRPDAPTSATLRGRNRLVSRSAVISAGIVTPHGTPARPASE